MTYEGNTQGDARGRTGDEVRGFGVVRDRIGEKRGFSFRSKLWDATAHAGAGDVKMGSNRCSECRFARSDTRSGWRELAGALDEGGAGERCAPRRAVTNWAGCCGGWVGCWRGSCRVLQLAAAPRSGLPGFLGTSGPAFVGLGGGAKKKKRSGSIKGRQHGEYLVNVWRRWRCGCTWSA